MGSLSKLAVGADVENNEKDSLGGQFIIDSDVYPFTIDLAYMSESSGGATAINFVMKKEDSSEWKHTMYVTNKKGEPFFIDKNSGKKTTLPGMNQANAVCLLTVGKNLSDLETEDKVIKLYNHDAKGDIPTKVEMVTALLGQEITFGVIKQIVDKNAKNDQGVYVPTGETREENDVDKIFRTSDGKTVTEIRAEAETAEFIDLWKDKNAGTVRNKAKGASGTGAVAGTPQGSEAKPQKSLFG